MWGRNGDGPAMTDPYIAIDWLFLLGTIVLIGLLWWKVRHTARPEPRSLARASPAEPMPKSARGRPAYGWLRAAFRRSPAALPISNMRFFSRVPSSQIQALASWPCRPHSKP
jgi:hypothetical protein